MKPKLIGLLVAVVLVGALVAVAARATSAYFTDSKSGTITGTIGDIKITTTGGTVAGGDGINFFWDEMLPGVVYTAPINVQNTSTSNSEDLWIHFYNLTALSALNQLGRYGAVTIDVGGTPVFQSNNLNDNTVRGGTIGNGGALPEWVQLALNVGPTASRVVTFKFAYASKMTQPEPGAVFNQYPVIATAGNPCLDGDAYYNGASFLTNMLTSPYPYGGSGNVNTNPAYTYYAQVTVRGGDVPGSGLPFQIVATQPGILPTDGGSYATIIP